MTPNHAYANYWRRKKLASGPLPHFPVRRWWPTGGLCDIEQVIFDAISGSPSLLDVGAGDLRMMRKFQDAGYSGQYDTLDFAPEFSYTYQDVAEVQRKYTAILCLDVIEHLPLAEALTMVNSLSSLMEPGGVLIIQTPNARCIRDPLSWDMTHLHSYNLADLWSYLTCAGFAVRGFRVVFGPKRRSPLAYLKFLTGAYVATRLLGCDYADNLVLIAEKS